MRITRMVVATSLGVGSLTGCLSSRVQGSVVAQGTEGGAFQGTVATCGSGAAEGFRGVDLFSADGRLRLRIIQNPDPTIGPTILVWENVEGKTVVFKLERRDCVALFADVHETSMFDLPRVEGSTSFDCTLKTGGTLRGNLRFASCR